MVKRGLPFPVEAGIDQVLEALAGIFESNGVPFDNSKIDIRSVDEDRPVIIVVIAFPEYSWE